MGRGGEGVLGMGLLTYNTLRRAAHLTDTNPPLERHVRRVRKGAPE